jgi:hypothetical protein
VPIILRGSTTNSSSNKILWENPRKSSTKFCRPIKFLLKKETPITTVEEINAVELQIKSLNPTHIVYNNMNIYIKHTLIFSMIDGKVNMIVSKI